MTPRIESLKNKKLVGKWLIMSLARNKTADLWKSFMPRRSEITNNLNNDLISMQVYSTDYFKDFNPAGEFQKWAAVEVSDFDTVPNGMETYILPGGLYAVFDYKGPGNNPDVFEHIFRIWLPDSDYILDGRPHFEVLGDQYKNNAPTSEEEIWIPIKPK